MSEKNRILKYLVEKEKCFPGCYTSVGDSDFLAGHDQQKLIKICMTLATEDGLLEWEHGSDLGLTLRLTDLGKGYFSRRRFNRKSYWSGVASGVIVLLSGEILLYWLIRVIWPAG